MIDDVVRRARSQYDSADAALREGKASDAMDQLGQALTTLDEIDDGVRETDLIRAEVIWLISWINDKSELYAKAAGGFARSRDLFMRHLPLTHPLLIRSRYDAAEAVRFSGESSRAAPELLAVAESLRTAATGQSQDVPAEPRDEGSVAGRVDLNRLRFLALKNASAALIDLDRFAEAEACIREALPLVPNTGYRLDLLLGIASVQDQLRRPVETDQIEAAITELTATGEDRTSLLYAKSQFATFLQRSDRVRAGVILEEVVAATRDDAGLELVQLHGYSLVSLGSLRMREGDVSAAIGLLAAGSASAERFFAHTAGSGDTLQRRLRPPLPVGERLVALTRSARDRSAAVKHAYRATAGWKGVQVEFLRAQHDVVKYEAADGEYLLSEATRIRGLGPPPSEAEQEYQDHVENAIAASVHPDQVTAWFDRSDLEKVQEVLRSDTALVEYVHVDELPLGDIGYPVVDLSEPSYVAFVIRADREPEIIPLGAAAVIDEAVVALRLAIPGASGRPAPAGSDWRAAALAVSQLLWAPLERAVDGAPRVIIAPDRSLYGLPFDVLPDRGGTLPLLGSRIVSTVGTGRDLVRFEDHVSVASGRPSIVAAPDYGLPGTPFTHLPGTLTEGAKIAELLRVEPTLADDATREYVLSLDNPEMIHLASHGYGSLVAERPDDVRSALRSCGVVLAGANVKLAARSGRMTGGAESLGILTAMDVLSMSLAATDLVALSACETGLGAVDDSEGLLGLARSFIIGGARSVVSSLWQVDDTVTQLTMTDFYTELLNGIDRADALVHAKRRILARWPDWPHLWAGFVLQGDTGVLRRFEE